MMKKECEKRMSIPTRRTRPLLLLASLCLLHTAQAAAVPPKVATPEGKAPGDATVVFDGGSKDALVNAAGAVLGWPVEAGELVIKGSEVGAFTKLHFSDAQIHVEFTCPKDGKKGGGAGNSGLYIHGLYELQIHNSYDQQIAPEGMLGAIYGQHVPPVNVARPAEQWQVYDIIFHAPRRDEVGQVCEPGRITAFLNGVLLYENAPIKEPTVFGPLHHRPTPYSSELYAKIKQTGRGPLFLQDHNSPVRFRNIWIRELKRRE
jgi:hypothetical protein